MISAHHRAEFDATVDDVVDTSVRYLRASEAGRAARRRELNRSTFISAIAFFVVTMSIGGWPSWQAAAVVAGLSVVWALIFWWGYSQLYEGYVRRRMKAFAQEQVGGRETLHCIMDLRPEGVWTRTNETELLQPWKDAVSVRDAEGGIEIMFRTSGFLLIRDRGFASPEHRTEFLRRTRELAQGA